MSYHDYKISLLLNVDDPPFYALIMAAMRRADSDNAVLLQRAFPGVWEELMARYHASGGYLPGEEV